MKFALLVAAFAICCVSAGYSQDQKAGALQIVDAKLGKDVQDRMIVGEDSTFAKDDKVYLWLKTAGGAGDSITVAWSTGTMTKTSKLAIGGAAWRTWSWKTAAKAGDWTVTVSDAAGTELKKLTFKVQ